MWNLFNIPPPLDSLITLLYTSLFLPSLLLTNLSLPLLAAWVQMPLSLRGRGGVVEGEGAAERMAASLSTVLLLPPSATLVSSLFACVASVALSVFTAIFCFVFLSTASHRNNYY